MKTTWRAVCPLNTNHACGILSLNCAKPRCSVVGTLNSGQGHYVVVFKEWQARKDQYQRNLNVEQLKKKMQAEQVEQVDTISHSWIKQSSTETTYSFLLTHTVENMYFCNFDYYANHMMMFYLMYKITQIFLNLLKYVMLTLNSLNIY